MKSILKAEKSTDAFVGLLIGVKGISTKPTTVFLVFRG